MYYFCMSVVKETGRTDINRNEFENEIVRSLQVTIHTISKFKIPPPTRQRMAAYGGKCFTV